MYANKTALEKFQKLKSSILVNIQKIYSEIYNHENEQEDNFKESSEYEKMAGSSILKSLSVFCNSKSKNIAVECSQILEILFDQYRGIRQVGDFRSVKEIKPEFEKIVPMLDSLIKICCTFCIKLINNGKFIFYLF